MKIKLVGRSWSHCGINDVLFGRKQTGDIIKIDRLEYPRFVYMDSRWFFGEERYRIEIMRDEFDFTKMVNERFVNIPRLSDFSGITEPLIMRLT